jgi:hypothetical protein
MLESGEYDVYVVLFKGGKVSEPVKINTAKGGQDVDRDSLFVVVASDSNQAVWSDNGGVT